MKSNSQKTNIKPKPAATDIFLDAEIQREAHKIWVAEGYRHGDHLRHWLQAEKEVLRRYGKV
jgi:hypothetical protein